MKNYLQHDEWKIIEEGFHRKHNRISESVFSIGNGRMGQRANFEEAYSGDTLPGNYVAGVYYTDKTKVGWWKIGYPDYFAKVLNATNWIGIDIELDGEPLDLAHCEVEDFRRVLDMKAGFLERSFTATMKSGKKVKVSTKRFCSMADDEIGALRYTITPINFSGMMRIMPYLDADVKNEDANYDEKFWDGVDQEVGDRSGYVIVETKKTAFQVATAMQFRVQQDGQCLAGETDQVQKAKFVGAAVEVACQDLQPITIEKFVGLVSSFNYNKIELAHQAQTAAQRAIEAGFDQLLKDQATAWAKKWENSDIIIRGDVAAQQGIRFNIFQLHQTYTGEDERLNIGPKGFTGEKYGGSTYWDTEAYCLPFYLATAEQQVGRQLLIYRYKHLQKAIENAAKLGFSSGAALYPMVTMNGEECHNEWEITFEEIHRNGAIAYAIYDYVRYTGDQNYLSEYGLEVLIAIARFWAQRVHYVPHKEVYMIHGVTGPNEYENNVNNNWYTNYIARWCLMYALDVIDQVKSAHPTQWTKLADRIKFYEYTETNEWKRIIEKMYFPYDEQRQIFLQADGFLDKALQPVNELEEKDQPLCQNWSWDRILRSCFIKQADTLQGLYFFEDHFDEATIRRHFEFYEPMTVHESSLSPCVHVILAAKIGEFDKAYDLYLRTARLDLDDYNNDTEDGCHITSMAGTWMAVVKGFGGFRVYQDQVNLRPYLPEQWTGYAFKIRFRGQLLEVKTDRENVRIFNHSDQSIQVKVFEMVVSIDAQSEKVLRNSELGKAIAF